MKTRSRELTGWLLDVYDDPKGGLKFWLLGEDDQRYCLHQDFPVTFYAAGPSPRLRLLWQFLQDQPMRVKLERTTRRDLFQSQPLTVLAIQVERSIDQPVLFRQVAVAFPDLNYYDADLTSTIRFAAIHKTFALAYCRIGVDEGNNILDLSVLNSAWELDPPAVPLRVMTIEPNCDPFHTSPTSLLIICGRNQYRQPLDPQAELLINLRAILRRHDPDLLLTNWGDTWLLPHLLELAEKTGLYLPLNRDEECSITQRPERTYFAYGHVIYRGQQMHLFGRWHIDAHNAVMYNDYGLDGILELARVTSLPMQTVARVSPGTGISSMQIVTALRQGVLVPWHKQQAESQKTALELLQSDQGGMVYQPTIGLHSDVAEIDFISMYPSIMNRFNISPETVGSERPTAELVPGLESIAEGQPPGLVPQTLAPLLEKRIALKTALMSMPKWDPRRKPYQAAASAHKWLLVTCFGYLGYKNARFGRIEAHEAVTAYGREALLRAKEAAEDLGFTVLHMYVDGLWVHKPGLKQVTDFQPLLNEILERTGLPIALDGIYRWVTFLASRPDKRVPVPNRYFGVFQDSSIKIRGIEARRHDTPKFVSETQVEILAILAKAPDAQGLTDRLPEIEALIRQRIRDLRQGRVAIEKLLARQTVSRDLAEFRTPSPAAQAASQLQAAGKSLRPGQSVRFLYLRGGKSHVAAWGLPDNQACKPAELNTPYYIELLMRAVHTVVEPLGISRKTLDEHVFDRVQSLPLPMFF